MRCEFDAKEGVLTYSVNGAEPEVGFTGITDALYPACGSYRSGVQVRLLKVEMYRTKEQRLRGAALDQDMDWCLDEAHQNRRDKTILSVGTSIPGTKSGSSSSSSEETLTARGSAGQVVGVHDWTFELQERRFCAYAFGVFQGVCVPAPEQMLGTAGAGAGDMAMAWHTDGTLHANGKQVGANWGLQHLPLPRVCAVSVRLDIRARTLTYYVDGKKVGIAFGPEGSGAACTDYPCLSLVHGEEGGEEGGADLPSRHRDGEYSAGEDSLYWFLRLRCDATTDLPPSHRSQRVRPHGFPVDPRQSCGRAREGAFVLAALAPVHRRDEQQHQQQW